MRCLLTTLQKFTKLPKTHLYHIQSSPHLSHIQSSPHLRYEQCFHWCCLDVKMITLHPPQLAQWVVNFLHTTLEYQKFQTQTKPHSQLTNIHMSISFKIWWDLISICTNQICKEKSENYKRKHFWINEWNNDNLARREVTN